MPPGMPSGHRSWERMPPPPSIAGDAETTGWGAAGFLLVAWLLLEGGQRAATRHVKRRAAR